ncbi:MAG: hypothetical protein V1875_00620 [Candidatus Altiarchaeota archaeon]
MKVFAKIAVYGFVAWLIPFLLSIPFFSAEGRLIVDEHLFKSIMIIVGSLSAGLLLIDIFKDVKKEQIQEGFTIGVIWFVMNILLDVIVLLPMSGMAFGQYYAEIGMRYLAMPIMSLTMGAAIQVSKKA